MTSGLKTTNTLRAVTNLAAEHDGELVPDPLEQLLDGGRVADEGSRHGQPARRHVTHCRLSHKIWSQCDEKDRGQIINNKIFFCFNKSLFKQQKKFPHQTLSIEQ